LTEPPQGWWEWYGEISRAMGYSVERDREAAMLLGGLFEGRPCILDSLRERVKNIGVAVIAGAANELERDAYALSRLGTRGGYILFAADGAAGGLMEHGLSPDIISTDLDGGISLLRQAWSRGATLFIHAHGDNLGELREAALLFPERAEATCQCEPRGHIHNLGGFTDGDRAAYIAAALGARRIVTIGMCLDCEVGAYSKPGHRTQGEWLASKRKKMEYARRLLTWLSGIRRDIEFIDASSGGSSIPGFKKSSIEDALR